MYDAKKALLEILRLGLQSGDYNLKDAIVTYIALTNLTAATNILENYIPTEEIYWLSEYASRVVNHLYKALSNRDSISPTSIEEDTAVMEEARNLELRWKSKFPELEE